MFARKKRTLVNGFTLGLLGFAFFAVMSVYAFIKLDASLNRPHAQPIEAEEQKEVLFTYYTNPATKVIGTSEAERMWANAESALQKYFAEINSGNYTEAIAVRNSDYLVGTAAAYISQLENSKENDILGDVIISNIERIEGGNKNNRKVFRFQKSVVWSFDGKIHNEIKKAYLALRGGEWKIDYFELERKF